MNKIFSIPSSIKVNIKKSAQSVPIYPMRIGQERIKNGLRFSDFIKERHTMYEMTSKTVNQKAQARTALNGVSNRKGYHVVSLKREERNIKNLLFVPPYAFIKKRPTNGSRA